MSLGLIMASFPFSIGGDVDVASSSGSGSSSSSDRDDGASVVDLAGNVLSGASGSSSRRRSGSPNEAVAIVDDATAILYTGFEEAFGGEASAPWLPVWYGAADVQGASEQFDHASDMLSDDDGSAAVSVNHDLDDAISSALSGDLSYFSSANVSGGESSESESEDAPYDGDHRDGYIEPQHHLDGVAPTWLTAMWPAVSTPLGPVSTPPSAPWAESATFPSDAPPPAGNEDDDAPTSLDALAAWPASVDEHVLHIASFEQEPKTTGHGSWTAPSSPSTSMAAPSPAASPGPALASAAGAAQSGVCHVCGTTSVYCRQMCRRCYDHQPRMLQLKQARQQRYNKSEKGLARVRRSKARNKQRRAASGSGSSSSSSTEDDDRE